MSRQFGFFHSRVCFAALCPGIFGFSLRPLSPIVQRSLLMGPDLTATYPLAHFGDNSSMLLPNGQILAEASTACYIYNIATDSWRRRSAPAAGPQIDSIRAIDASRIQGTGAVTAERGRGRPPAH